MCKIDGIHARAELDANLLAKKVEDYDLVHTHSARNKARESGKTYGMIPQGASPMPGWHSRSPLPPCLRRSPARPLFCGPSFALWSRAADALFTPTHARVPNRESRAENHLVASRPVPTTREIQDSVFMDFAKGVKRRRVHVLELGVR